MKRKIPGLFLIIFMCAITYGASITVTSPKSGDVWCINQQHEITWTTNGQMHENVRIRLLNHPGLDVALAIVNSTPTDNKSYFWTIPATVSPGFYRMRVRTTDAAVWHDGEVFEIKDCSSLKPDLVIRDITFQVSGSSYFYSTRPVVNAKLVNNGPGPAPEAGVKLVVRGPGGFLDKAIYPAYKTQPLGPNETFQVGFGTVQLPGPGNNC